MSDRHRYSDNPTDQEAQLGFQCVLVANPDAEFEGNPNLVPAIVYAIARGNRIIKLQDLNGNITYQHQVYGRYGSTGNPDWMPVQVAFPSAEQAIRSNDMGRDNAGDELNPKVNPVDSELELRCPDCGHDFLVSQDHLLVVDPVSCPACGVGKSSSEMVTFKSP